MFLREVYLPIEAEAGCALAQRLLKFKDERPVVLALPRGGVPVAFEVARALEAPLDLVLVRKIGAPFQPELALGAVVDGGRAETVLNDELVTRVRDPRELYRGGERAPAGRDRAPSELYLADRARGARRRTARR